MHVTALDRTKYFCQYVKFKVVNLSNGVVEEGNNYQVKYDNLNLSYSVTTYRNFTAGCQQSLFIYFNI